MKPTTAVIFAAGTGTRFLPVTSAVQKELLPVLNRPVIDYVVADCVTAGITRVIFVIRPGQTGLKDFYLGNHAYESSLKRLGKTAALDMLAGVQRQASFEFVEQADSAGYGTATALQVALPHLDPSEPVLVCSGDDFVWHSDGTSELTAFVETYAKSGAEGAIMALKLDSEQIHQYGALAIRAEGTGEYLTDIVEKPAPGTESSHLANISKYILSGALREYVRTVKPRVDPAESYITDAVAAGAQEHRIVVHQVTGTYLDTGNPTNWLHANQVVFEAAKPKL